MALVVAHTLSVSAIAAGQVGLLTSAQAALCGYSAADVDVLCRRGDWTRVRRGIFAPRPAPTDSGERQRLEFGAAILAVGMKGAAIAHLSAARAWGAKWLKEPDNLEVWVACDVPGKSRHYPGLRILPAALPAQDITELDGLPISTVARTSVDLARHLPFEDAVVAVDSLRFRYKITDEQLEAVLDRCRGWPFIRRARRAIAFSIMEAESPLESRFRLRFAEIGAPPCRWQVYVVDGDGERRRLDGLFGLRAGLEIDGRSKYKTPEDVWEEKRREDALRRVNIPLLRLTAQDLRLSAAALLQRIQEHMISTGDWPTEPIPITRYRS